jgi:GT2 family glycosyltransferase
MSRTRRASVIVPVHGRAGLTRRCLDRLLADLPPDCEAIVVDDASPDDTPSVLAGYGDAIRVVRLERNGGYGVACNGGAEVAAGEMLVFLNNDTEPGPGWLESLLDYAASHPDADAIGTKLLYPTGAVQHAGVVFGQDGYPHNLYTGLPGDHPAVNRTRRLQAVTGACLALRRPAFERLGGFDGGFLNSLEDIDLCLRLGEAGGEVHYCPQSSLVHLESASRGREGRFECSVALYRERWRGRVRRDDLAVYVEDRLIEVEYPASYPLSIAVSPLLASVRMEEREPELERLLSSYGRHLTELLREVVRLSVEVADRGEEIELPSLPDMSALTAGTPRSAADHAELLAAVRKAQAAVAELGDDGRLGYPDLVERVLQEAEEAVPEGATVLVMSRGDRELLRLRGRCARHFPQGPDGGYLGHHPSDDKQAIAMLERERREGAEYLLMPVTAGWWLQHYTEFADHLRDRYPEAEYDSCSVFSLEPA